MFLKEYKEWFKQSGADSCDLTVEVYRPSVQFFIFVPPLKTHSTQMFKLQKFVKTPGVSFINAAYTQNGHIIYVSNNLE